MVSKMYFLCYSPPDVGWLASMIHNVGRVFFLFVKIIIPLCLVFIAAGLLVDFVPVNFFSDELDCSQPALHGISIPGALSPPAFDWSESAVQPEPPDITARAAILMDFDSGTILFARNRHQRLAPASMIKLLVMHILLSEIEQERISIDDQVPLPPESWAENAPPHSSLMFLGPGQRATVNDLLLGLAVPSGNDAAIAVALLLEQSVPAFVERMNRELREMGLYNSFVVEPSGYSPENYTTADDFVRFLRLYISLHPQALADYHSQRSFVYPRPENMPAGFFASQNAGESSRLPLGSVFQNNFNRLLWLMPDADGLKTGSIPEVGYNLAGTAERDGTRLIALLMGVQARNPMQGNELRALEAQRLLEYGFQAFVRKHPHVPSPSPLALYGADSLYMPIYVDANWAMPAEAQNPTGIAREYPGRERPGVLFPRGVLEHSLAEFRLSRSLYGPVVAGAQVGELVLLFQGEQICSVSVCSRFAAGKGNALQHVFDAVRLLPTRIRATLGENVELSGQTW